MFKKLFTSLLGASLLGASVLIGSYATPAIAAEKQKVVYHVNYYGAKKQTAALRNIQNHINAVGAENLDLKVVMHGNGVSLVMEPDALGSNKMKEGNANQDMQARISTLKDQGIEFKICANTLRGRKVSNDSLYDLGEGDIVPSGVAELAILQSISHPAIQRIRLHQALSRRFALGARGAIPCSFRYTSH